MCRLSAAVLGWVRGKEGGSGCGGGGAVSAPEKPRLRGRPNDRGKRVSFDSPVAIAFGKRSSASSTSASFTSSTSSTSTFTSSSSSSTSTSTPALSGFASTFAAFTKRCSSAAASITRGGLLPRQAPLGDRDSRGRSGGGGVDRGKRSVPVGAGVGGRGGAGGGSRGADAPAVAVADVAATGSGGGGSARGGGGGGGGGGGSPIAHLVAGAAGRATHACSTFRSLGNIVVQIFMQYEICNQI